MTFSYFPRIAAGPFASKKFADEYTKFFKKADTTGIQRSVEQGYESIIWHADWKDRDEKNITEYFKNLK